MERHHYTQFFEGQEKINKQTNKTKKLPLTNKVKNIVICRKCELFVSWHVSLQTCLERHTTTNCLSGFAATVPVEVFVQNIAQFLNMKQRWFPVKMWQLLCYWKQNYLQIKAERYSYLWWLSLKKEYELRKLM